MCLREQEVRTVYVLPVGKDLRHICRQGDTEQEVVADYLCHMHRVNYIRRCLPVNYGFPHLCCYEYWRKFLN